MSPKLSVVMSIYNAGGFLKEAVNSVLAQTFEDFEFIIIDDGSSDDSLAALRQIRDSRLRILTQPNRGLIASLNRGIEEASGQYIARMDADDRCEPDRFEIQVRYLDRHPQIALLGGAIATMDEMGNALAPCVRFPATHEQIWAGLGRRPWVFCHPAVMYRRAAAMDVGMYRRDFAHAEDVEFFARLMTRYRAANLPDVLLHYRICRGGVSLTKLAHGQINARLVAAIIDRWKPGDEFALTAQERRQADDAIVQSRQMVGPRKIESVYQARLGRELLRGRQWRRALRHYLTALRNDYRNKKAIAGVAAALFHLGGEPMYSQETPVGRLKRYATDLEPQMDTHGHR
jgi:glycosyltransferase involved in cell wall biosynthesis